MKATPICIFSVLAIAGLLPSCNDGGRRRKPVAISALANIQLNSRQDINVGGFATNVTIADVDQDGREDVVIARYQDSKLTWVKSLGNTAYAAPVDLPAGPLFPLTAGCVDLDGDNLPEVVSPDFVNNQLYIYKNLGGGNYANPQSMATVGGGLSLAFADFDKDGLIDIALGGVNTQEIIVHRGLGALSFASGFNYPVAGVPATIVATDLDNDSRVDLLFTDLYDNKLVGWRNTENLQINSHVQFSTLFSEDAGVAPFGLAVGDLDGDQKKEIVTSSAAVAVLSVWDLNNGAASFKASRNSKIVMGGIALADLNGDQKLDLAGACFEQFGLQIFEGNGNATFADPVFRATGQGPVFLATGDTTGDGLPDIHVANALSSEISIFHGSADSLVDGAIAYIAGQQPLFIKSADFNSDGKPDLISADNSGGKLFIFRNDGDFKFTNVAALQANGGGAYEPMILDFDNDGDFDIIALDAGGARVFKNNGAFTFVQTQNFVVNGGYLLGKVGDVNRDGINEFVASAPTLNAVHVFESVGGNIVFKESVATGLSPLGVDLGDMDRDGDVDIVVANNGGSTVSIATRSKTGAYKANALVLTVEPGPAFVKIGDFNNDNRNDFAVSHLDGNNIEVFTKTAGFKFNLTDVVETNGQPLAISVFDVNRDGRDDLLYVENATGRGIVRLSQPAGSFGAPITTFAAQYNTVTALAVDLDGDNLEDLVTSSSLTGLIEIHKNQSN